MKGDPHYLDLKLIVERFKIGCTLIEAQNYGKVFECIEKRWADGGCHHYFTRASSFLHIVFLIFPENGWSKMTMNNPMFAWVFLFLAGLFEIGWIFSLKFTEGFTRLLPLLFYAFFGLGAAFFLSLALRSMPVGVTYAIWVGIGIAGSNLLGMVIFEEPFKILRLLFVTLILAGIVGLKWSNGR